MKLTFKNPLALADVAQLVDAPLSEFAFGWAVRFKKSSATAWHRHFDDALNRLFVTDRPRTIAQRGLPPVCWYGVPEVTHGESVTFHGHAKVPSPNLCGRGFVTNMCRPSRLFLQSEMCLAGFECQMALVHVGEMVNSKLYERQWDVNVDGAIWNYVGRADQGGVPCPASRTQFTPITPESPYTGFEWLYGDNDGIQLEAQQ